MANNIFSLLASISPVNKIELLLLLIFKTHDKSLRLIFFRFNFSAVTQCMTLLAAFPGLLDAGADRGDGGHPLRGHRTDERRPESQADPPRAAERPARIAGGLRAAGPRNPPPRSAMKREGESVLQGAVSTKPGDVHVVVV